MRQRPNPQSTTTTGRVTPLARVIFAARSPSSSSMSVRRARQLAVRWWLSQSRSPHNSSRVQSPFRAGLPDGLSPPTGERRSRQTDRRPHWTPPYWAVPPGCREAERRRQLGGRTIVAAVPTDLRCRENAPWKVPLPIMGACRQRLGFVRSRSDRPSALSGAPTRNHRHAYPSIATRCDPSLWALL